MVKLKLFFGKKASINLAMSTIVMVIIGVVILTAGILLMRTFISGAEDIKEQLDTRTEAELERLMVDQGKKVAFPKNKVTLGGGESHIFGLGILNIDGNTYGDKFRIEIGLSKYVDEKGNLDDVSADSYLLYDDSDLTIKENQHKSEIIHVEVPKDAKKGSYIYNVYVYYTNNNDVEEKYDSVKKMYINVE